MAEPIEKTTADEGAESQRPLVTVSVTLSAPGERNYSVCVAQGGESWTVTFDEKEFARLLDLAVATERRRQQLGLASPSRAATSGSPLGSSPSTAPSGGIPSRPPFEAATSRHSPGSSLDCRGIRSPRGKGATHVLR